MNRKPSKPAVSPATVPSQRPAKAVRDQARRDEIVAAARTCVIGHGFHAASMAQIAEQAKMSVGQIYRYFSNKEAIVHAIVERIVTQRLAWIDSTGRQADLAGILARRMLGQDAGLTHDHALLLEVTAEATRNPEVAEMVRKADRRMHAKALATVRQDFPHLSEKEAAARVEFIAVLVEGTAFRRATEQPADTATLEALYREVIGRLLPAQDRAATAIAPKTVRRKRP